MSFGDRDMSIPGDFRSGERVEVSFLSSRWNLDMIGFPGVGNSHNYGLGIKIGILDTGYKKHRDFPIPASSKGFPYKDANDDHGHGTHVYGICASIAKNAQYHICKVLGKDGAGDYDQIALAIDYLVDEKKVNVINLSLGGNRYNEKVAQSIKNAIAKNVVFVTSSGNTGRDTSMFPASMEECISVGSVDRAMMLSRFSTTGKDIDIVAPGEDILSNWMDGYKRKSSGTSMSAPHITAICALIIDHFLQDHSRRPTVDEVKQTLYSNAVDLGLVGWDENYGNGLAKVKFHRTEKDKRVDAPRWMNLLIKVFAFALKWYLKRSLKDNK